MQTAAPLFLHSQQEFLRAYRATIASDRILCEEITERNRFGLRLQVKWRAEIATRLLDLWESTNGSPDDSFVSLRRQARTYLHTVLEQ